MTARRRAHGPGLLLGLLLAALLAHQSAGAEDVLPSSFDELQPAPALDVELLSATAGGGGGYGGDNSSGGYGDYGYSGSPSPSPSPLPSPSPSPLPAPGGNASFPPVPAPDGSTLCTGRAADAICSTKAPVLRGTLLSAGGLSGCEGIATSLVTGNQTTLRTDGNGTFIANDAALSFLAFEPAEACVDTLLGVPVGQAQQQLLPAVSPAVITPLSQLTVPASEGLEVLGTLTGSGRGARWSLLDEVYGAFGYNADALRMGFLTYENMTLARPAFAAIYGTNMQLAGLGSVLTSTLAPLLRAAPPPSGRRLQQAGASLPSTQRLQTQLAAQLWTRARAEGANTLISTSAIRDIMRATYDALASSSSGGAAVPPSKLDALLQAVSKIVGGTNDQLQSFVNEALQCEQSEAGSDCALAAATIMASYAAVQQRNLAASVADLASSLAANPGADLTAALQGLSQTFSGDSLQVLLNSTGITARKLLDSLAGAGASANISTPGNSTGDPWADLVIAVAKEKKRGLLGLLGLLGLIGVLPAGAVTATMAAFAASGIIFIAPGLILAPTGTVLPVLLNPRGVEPWPFNATCAGGALLALQPIAATNPQLPAYVQALLPKLVCLPAGDLYDVHRLPDEALPSNWSLPNGTVLIPDGGVIIIPPGTGNSSSPPTPPNNTNWWSTNQTVDVPGVVVTTPSDNGTIVVVVRPPNVTEGHGGSPSLPGGAPRDACRNKLPPIAPLSMAGGFAAAARPEMPQLFGAMHGIGFLSSCSGDYYFYAPLAPNDPNKGLLNADRTFGTPYKDFVTGPSYAATYGLFGVDNITGPGHAVSTGAWAGSPEMPAFERSCWDSWTKTRVSVPVGGLTPYPRDVTSQPGYAPQAVIGPIALLTLGQYFANASIPVQYDAAHLQLGVSLASGGVWGQGTLNSNPLRMIGSGKTPLVKAAVTTLAASAQALGVLSTARALAECQGVQMSNEIFVQWSAALLKPEVLASPSKLVAELTKLCLDGSCAAGAAKAYTAVDAQLAAIKTKYAGLPDTAAVPTSLYLDAVALTRAARVAQVDLHAAVAACCKAGAGAAAAAPFEPFSTNLPGLLYGADVNTTAIAAAVYNRTADGGGGSGGSDGGSGGGGGGGSTTTAAALNGKLLNLGFVKDCKGSVQGLLTGASAALATNGSGQFVVASPSVASYAFAADAATDSACVDGVTGMRLAFPWALSMPVRARATITAISLLTVPAAADPAVQAQYAAASASTDSGAATGDDLVPGYLWDHAYGMYGYNASALGADLLTFTGASVSQAWVVAIIGSSAQTYSTLLSAHKLLTGLLGGAGRGRDAIAAAVVDATYHAIMDNAPKNAAGVLVNGQLLMGLYRAAYVAATPAARRHRSLAAAAAAVPVDRLDAVFASVAQTVAASNMQLQTLVDAARTAAASPDSAAAASLSPAALLTNISRLAAVQQGDMVAGIATLSSDISTGYAADPAGYDPTTKLAAFLQEFNTTALEVRAQNTTVDIGSITDTLDTAVTNRGATPPADEPPPYYGWVAGPVIGGVAVLAAAIGAWVWWRRRQAAANTAFDAAAADKYAVDEDAAAATAAAAAGQQGPDGATPLSTAGVELEENSARAPAELATRRLS